jgi:hypothetical protein
MPRTKGGRIKAVGTEKPMPLKISPLMAKSTDQPFDDATWIFEMKWDGYRAIATVANGHVKLWSHNGLRLNAKFASIVQDLNKLKAKSAIVDGEIVVLDEQGAPLGDSRFFPVCLNRFCNTPNEIACSWRCRIRSAPSIGGPVNIHRYAARFLIPAGMGLAVPAMTTAILLSVTVPGRAPLRPCLTRPGRSAARLALRRLVLW